MTSWREAVEALDRALATKARGERGRDGGRRPVCALCGRNIVEGAKSEAGYDNEGRYFTRGPMCDPCWRGV